MRWAAIDFETATGRRDSACAVGVALVDDGRVVDVHHWLIQPPERRFARMNIAIHGITPADVRDAPVFPEVWAQVGEVTAGRVLIAHNAGFDMGVVRACCATYGLVQEPFEFFCTRVVGRRAWPQLGGYSLPVLSAHLGIELDHHQADSDARACAQIAVAALEVAGTRSLIEASETLGFEIGRVDGDAYEPCRAHRRSPRADDDACVAPA